MVLLRYVTDILPPFPNTLRRIFTTALFWILRPHFFFRSILHLFRPLRFANGVRGASPLRCSRLSFLFRRPRARVPDLLRSLRSPAKFFWFSMHSQWRSVSARQPSRIFRFSGF